MQSKAADVSTYLEEVPEERRAALDAAKLKVGKGCINFTKPERIPFDIVQSLLVATVKSPDDAC
ncbi:MAG: hypothetical protein U0841_31400 [Chloroflexia bacterium]